MKCATDGCREETSGKSKYCLAHKRAARERWKQMVAEKAAATSARADKFKAAVKKAVAAGEAAFAACRPRPMVVQQHESPLDDSSPVVYEEFVEDGVCGFAWAEVHPGNHPFANWLKKEGLGRKGVYGGVTVWCHSASQSMQRKEAYMRAYVETLVKELADPTLKIYPMSRLD